MKHLILAAAALLALTVGAQAQTVKLGSEGAYPPYNYVDEAGKLGGFDIDVGNEICKRASLTCEWVVNEWDTIIPNLIAGNYDAILAGMSITPERDEVIDFTQDYSPPTASAYVALSDGVDITAGTVAAQAATIQASYIAESGATLLEFATPEETVAAVRNGEADAVFADFDFLSAIVEESGGELMFVGDRVPIGGGVGVGLRESDTELRGKLDTAIQSMKDDGSLNELLIKWFGEDTDTY